MSAVFGTGNYLSKGTPAGFPTGNGAWTLVCWIYMTSIGATEYFHAHGVEASNDWNGIKVNNTLSFLISHYAPDNISDNALSSMLNRWVPFALVQDGANDRWYIDFSTKGVDSNAGISTPATNTHFVGAGNAGNQMHGNLANYKFWGGRALTEAQVYNELRSFQPQHHLSDLKVWLPLDWASVPSNVVDFSQNNGNYTKNGTLAVGQHCPF